MERRDFLTELKEAVAKKTQSRCSQQTEQQKLQESQDKEASSEYISDDSAKEGCVPKARQTSNTSSTQTSVDSLWRYATHSTSSDVEIQKERGNLTENEIKLSKNRATKSKIEHILPTVLPPFSLDGKDDRLLNRAAESQDDRSPKLEENSAGSKVDLLFELSRVLLNRQSQTLSADVWDFEKRPKTGRSIIYRGKGLIRPTVDEETSTKKKQTNSQKKTMFGQIVCGCDSASTNTKTEMQPSTVPLSSSSSASPEPHRVTISNEHRNARWFLNADEVSGLVSGVKVKDSESPTLRLHMTGFSESSDEQSTRSIASDENTGQPLTPASPELPSAAITDENHSGKSLREAGTSAENLLDYNGNFDTKQPKRDKNFDHVESHNNGESPGDIFEQDRFTTANKESEDTTIGSKLPSGSLSQSVKDGWSPECVSKKKFREKETDTRAINVTFNDEKNRVRPFDNQDLESIDQRDPLAQSKADTSKSLVKEIPDESIKNDHHLTDGDDDSPPTHLLTSVVVEVPIVDDKCGRNIPRNPVKDAAIETKSLSLDLRCRPTRFTFDPFELVQGNFEPGGRESPHPDEDQDSLPGTEKKFVSYQTVHSPFQVCHTKDRQFGVKQIASHKALEVQTTTTDDDFNHDYSPSSIRSRDRSCRREDEDRLLSSSESKSTNEEDLNSPRSFAGTSRLPCHPHEALTAASSRRLSRPTCRMVTFDRKRFPATGERMSGVDSLTSATFRDSGCLISDVSWCSQTSSDLNDCIGDGKTFPSTIDTPYKSSNHPVVVLHDSTTTEQPPVGKELQRKRVLGSTDEDEEEEEVNHEVTVDSSSNKNNNFFDIVSIEDTSSSLSPSLSPSSSRTARTVVHTRSVPTGSKKPLLMGAVKTTSDLNGKTSFATFPLVRGCHQRSSSTAFTLSKVDRDVISNLLITHSGDPVPGLKAAGVNHWPGSGRFLPGQRPLRHDLQLSVTVPEPTSFHRNANRIFRQVFGVAKQPGPQTTATTTMSREYDDADAKFRQEEEQERGGREQEEEDEEEEERLFLTDHSGIESVNFLQNNSEKREPDYENENGQVKGDDDEEEEEEDDDEEEEEVEQEKGLLNQNTNLIEDRSKIMIQELDNDPIEDQLIGSRQPVCHDHPPIHSPLRSFYSRPCRPPTSNPRRLKKSTILPRMRLRSAGAKDPTGALPGPIGADEAAHSSDADTESLCQGEQRPRVSTSYHEDSFARSLIEYVRSQDLAEITEDIRSLYRYQIDAASSTDNRGSQAVAELVGASCCCSCAPISYIPNSRKRTGNDEVATNASISSTITTTTAAEVEVSGSGLMSGAVGRSSIFSVNIRETHGSLKIQVEGPRMPVRCYAEAETESKYRIFYTPEEVGLYTIKITWNGISLKGSPFEAKIVDPRQVKPIGEWKKWFTGSGRARLTSGIQRIIEFGTRHAGPGQLTAKIFGPDGELPVEVSISGKHRYAVTFTPRSQGEYYLTVFWTGMVTTCFAFEAVKGESEVGNPRSLLHCGRPDAVRSFDYCSEEDGEPVDGVTCSSRDRVIGSSVVLCKGLEARRRFVGEEIEVEILTHRAGSGDLSVSCSGPLNTVQSKLRDNGGGHFTMLATPLQPGLHRIDVKFNGTHIPGSPFRVSILPPPLTFPPLDDFIPCPVPERSEGPPGEEPPAAPVGDRPDGGSGAWNALKRIHVHGPGIRNGVLSTFDSRFIVETKGAGDGQLTIKVRGPKGTFRVEMCRDRGSEDRGRSIECRYSPSDVGLYVINIQWCSVNVTGSPFGVRIFACAEELLRYQTSGTNETTYRLDDDDDNDVDDDDDDQDHFCNAPSTST